LFDGLGSVVAVTDSTGAVVSTYKYDPYGKHTATTGTVTNPWRFAGQYYDSQTGLYKMGQRYYNPANARWTQQDPIRQIGSFHQSDRCPYAGDDPINLTDPNGLYFGESWVTMLVTFVSENADTIGWGALTVAAGGLTTVTFLACEEGTAGAGTLSACMRLNSDMALCCCRRCGDLLNTGLKGSARKQCGTRPAAGARGPLSMWQASTYCLPR